MGGASLPPGFRFHPTDEELIGYYLKRKVQGLQIELEVIPVVKLYKFDPWELPEKSFLPKHDMEWFFFCPRDLKYPNGLRTNRATTAGYWKATGKDRKVLSRSSLLGYRKTLVFYRGRAPFGDRTSWIMHEYRLCDNVSQGTPSFQGPFSLCRVMKKSKQKTSYLNSETRTMGVGTSSKNAEERKDSESNFSSSITEPYQTIPISNEPTLPSGPKDLPTFWVSPSFILDSSKELSQQNQEGQFGYSQPEYILKPMVPWHPYELGISSSSSYSNFTEEDDLVRFGCLSPYSGDESLMGFFGNEDHISYDGYDWTNSLSNIKHF